MNINKDHPSNKKTPVTVQAQQVAISVRWTADDVRDVFERTREPVDPDHYVAILNYIGEQGREVTHVAGLNFESVDELINLYLDANPDVLPSKGPSS